jgi:ABC-type lipoprotein export system ATPase subunit
VRIELKNIIPNALNKSPHNYTDIWNKDILINSKDFVHIIAPSGAGKSTLLGILYGTRNDYKGDLLFDNIITEEFKGWSEIRTYQLAIVFQDIELLDDLTVIDNIQLKNQLTNHFSNQEILEMLKKLNIKELKDQKVGVLSRGEKQRVAIIRSLSMPFSWLLLDEPFSALDKENTQNSLSLIKEQVVANNSGVILANLEEDNWFKYTKTFKMVAL